MISHGSSPWCGKILSVSLYLSHTLKNDLLSFCLNPLIWLLSKVVLLGGKYLAKKTFFNSSHVVMELDSKDYSHALALSLNEKGKICNRITSGLTPLAFTISAYCTNPDRWRFESSVGLPENWFCCTTCNSEDFNSKSFWSMAEAAMLLCGAS